ncbi:hypothetical protein [Haloferula rosea]|uniref:Uncharacterized protein n=1 Tax=Haloferula rosea TaxID=490093 RepID=A0A934VGI8_9BACT|nr:hypothetical protein [Haloferula rosea]MBK1828106.1 hypothetical protein [Haloferula rosea]
MSGKYGLFSSWTLISYLSGLALLIFITVFFSLAFDGSITVDRDRANLLYQLEKGAEYEEELRLERIRLAERMKSDVSDRLDQHHTITQISSLSEALELERRLLTTERDQLRREIQAIPQQLADHRSTYRREQRKTLLQQNFEELRLRSGRIFVGVTIKGFDETSMQIRHSGGITRIPMVDLSDEWKERIHWRADEVSGINSPRS